MLGSLIILLVFITNISAGTYIFALLVALFTAFLAVASQTLKAAWANPGEYVDI